MAQYRIGKHFFKATTNKDLIGRMVQQLKNDMALSQFDSAKAKGRNIAAAMEKAGNKELAKLGPYLATNLIGQVESRGASVDIDASYFGKGLPESRYDPNEGITSQAALFNKYRARGSGRGRVAWKATKLKTEKAKGHSLFFLDTGELQQYFKDNAQSIVENTGGISVKFVPKNEKAADTAIPGREIFGSLVINTASKLSVAWLPGLVAGDWSVTDPRMKVERRIFPHRIADKLSGNKVTRQLFQPALQFWLLYRVPRVLNAAFLRGFNVASRRPQAGRVGSRSKGLPV